MQINVLGTKYTIEERTKDEDAILSDGNDGYCDKTVKLIVVCNDPDKSDLKDYDEHKKLVYRHEIIHAFLYESGLHESFSHEIGHDETYVDWIAVQFPKILEVYKKVGCI
jgi:hypothetical protein